MDDVKQAAQGAIEQVQQRIEDGVEQLRRHAPHYVEQGRRHVQTVGQALEEQIRANPLPALALAAGVGFAFGLLWSRRA